MAFFQLISVLFCMLINFKLQIFQRIHRFQIIIFFLDLRKLLSFVYYDITSTFKVLILKFQRVQQI